MNVRNPVKAKLRAGGVSVGSWLNLASPLAAEAMAGEGFEWLTVDTEHCAWGIAEMTNAFRAIESRGAVPLARSWSHNPEVIARILDAGALGVVVPHVSTPDQAERLARAVRYPPRGERSVGSCRAATFQDYYARADEEILLIPMIEDPVGVANIEAIMSVDGVDVALLGTSDLALAMGIRRDEMDGNAEHEEMVMRVLAGCRQAGKPAGIPVGDALQAKRWIERGFQFIDLSNDLALLRAMVRAQLSEVAAS
ncbi:MAG TPA: aldolase/citrate lyase family protein [Chloroflexota bacterium]|nr:aldolase/citrate lyase family protein [Chloroflexota bacterium]